MRVSRCAECWSSSMSATKGALSTCPFNIYPDDLHGAGQPQEGSHCRAARGLAARPKLMKTQWSHVFRRHRADQEQRRVQQMDRTSTGGVCLNLSCACRQAGVKQG